MVVDPWPWHKTAFVLAAGFGTRLQKWTKDIPKAMVPLAGQPMVQRLLARLSDMGFERVVMNTHYQAHVIRDCIERWRVDYDLDILESYEPEILGTGGALAAARSLLDDEPFWIFNCDVCTDFNVASLAGQPQIYHELRGGSGGVLVLRHDAQAAKFGSFAVDSQSNPRIVRMLHDGNPQKHTIDNLMFTGIHLLTPDVFSYVKPEFGGVFEQYYLPAFRDGKPFFASLHEGYWYDLGTEESLKQAECDIYHMST